MKVACSSSKKEEHLATRLLDNKWWWWLVPGGGETMDPVPCAFSPFRLGHVLNLYYGTGTYEMTTPENWCRLNETCDDSGDKCPSDDPRPMVAHNGGWQLGLWLRLTTAAWMVSLEWWTGDAVWRRWSRFCKERRVVVVKTNLHIDIRHGGGEWRCIMSPHTLHDVWRPPRKKTIRVLYIIR